MDSLNTWDACDGDQLHAEAREREACALAKRQLDKFLTLYILRNLDSKEIKSFITPNPKKPNLALPFLPATHKKILKEYGRDLSKYPFEEDYGDYEIPSEFVSKPASVQMNQEIIDGMVRHLESQTNQHDFYSACTKFGFPNITPESRFQETVRGITAGAVHGGL